MKKTITLLLFCLAILRPAAQIQRDDELAIKLQGKTKFNDIKNTVNNHYYTKLAALRTTDSIEKKKINRQLKMWNRQFWINENYTNANGEVVNASLLNYNAFQQLNTQRTYQIEAQTQNWQLHGPYNSDNGMGRFDKIAFHPTDPNTIWAGSPNGGLFRTTNGGADWFPVSSFIPSLGIAGIAINPLNTNIIYVLTGDPNSGNGGFVSQYLYRTASLGVFKTIDGGVNWFQTGMLAPVSPTYQGEELIINPNNPEILIAATSVGMYRTTDGGFTWNLVNSPFPNNCIWDIKFKPGDPNIVYATGTTTTNVANGICFFIRSTDNGANFTAIADPTTINNLLGANRIAIGVTPANQNRVVLFAGPAINGATGFQGFFSSANSGQNFTRLTQSPNLFANNIGNAVSTDQSSYNICVAISPINENQIVVGGLCVWISQNGGIAGSWIQASAYWPDNAPYMHPDIHAVAFNPLNNNLYCANDGGFYGFTGSGWGRLFNGATATQFYHFERENDENDVWGGAQDNGILEQDNGGTYFMFAFGDGYDVMTDHDYLVADGEDDDIYYSVNQSIYKDVIGGIADISVPNNQNYFANLAMSPDLEDMIYAGYSNATYVSIDAGDNWVVLGNAPVPGNWCISSCPSNINVLYAAGNGQISRCQSAVWTNLTASLQAAGYDPTLKITDIDVHPGNHNVVYISVGGSQFNAKVFRTQNGGTNWENLTFNLPNVPVFSVKRDGFDGLYAGTSIGVFYKRNGVNYWEPFSNGLPPVPVSEIELWPQDNQVWVSTFGRGIWFTTAYGSCAADVTLTVPVAGNFYSEASNNITSSQRIEGGSGTFVKYNAGNSIRLVDGFKASFGSRFKTFTTGCGGQVDLQRNTMPPKTDSIPPVTPASVKKDNP